MRRLINNPPSDVICTDPVRYHDYNRNLTIEMHGGVKSANVHSHTFYELELIIKGKGKAYVNGKEYVAERGLLYFADPMDSHCFVAEDPLTMWNVSFIDCDIYSDALEELFSNADIRAVNISEEDTERMCSLFEMLEYECDHPLCDDLQELLLKAILKLSVRYIPESAKKDYQHNPIFKTVRYIQSHFKEDISLDDVAEHVGFSPPYLSRLFHKKMGLSYKQYLTAIRVSFAKRLLETTDMKNVDVCFEAGFNSYSSFSRAFEKTVGIAPGKYSEKYKAK